MARADAKYSVTLEDRTQQALRRIQGNLGALHSAFGKLSLAAGALSGIGGGGFLLMTKRALEGADAIAKSADAAGLSTDKYQEYTDALSFAGITTETFNSVTVAFVKRVGEARNGVGPLVSGLKGVNDELLAGIVNAKNQDEALDLVFDAMGQAGSAAERAAIANAAFSRTGVVLARSVKDGTEALRANMKAARDSGRVIDESLLRNAEAANDAMARLQRTIGANFSKALLQNATAIESVGNRLAEALPSMIAFVDRLLVGLGAIEESDFSKAANQIGGIEDRMRGVAVEIGRVAAEVELLEQNGGAPAAIAQAEGRLRLLQAQARALDEQYQRLNRTINNAQGGMSINVPLPALPAPDVFVGDEVDPVEAEKQRQMDLTEAARVGARERFMIEANFAAASVARAQESAAIQLAIEQTKQSEIAMARERGMALLGQVGILMNSESRKMFELGKAASTAHAIISGIEAVQDAYKWGQKWGGPPLGAAFASAAALVTAARVQQIRSVQFTGSGSAANSPVGNAVPGGAGPGGSAGTLAPIGQPEPQTQRVTNVYISGYIDTAEGRRVLGDIFRDLDRDDVVFLSANGANAQAIRSGV